MENNKLFIGIGGCGNALLHSYTQKHGEKYIKDINKQCVYMNFAQSDLDKSMRGTRFIFDYGGTGKSPAVGREMARKNISEIEEFLKGLLKQRSGGKTNKPFAISEVVIFSSLGGGTGSSLISTLLDVFDKDVAVILFGVLSSDKEGIATLPNAIKCFQSLYNNYVLTDHLKSFFILDNEKIEKDYGIPMMDYHGINEVFVDMIDKVIDDDVAFKSSEGYASLDYNERKRVLQWGQGVADLMVLNLSGDEKLKDIKYLSSIYASKHNVKSIKAVGVHILFKQKKDKVTKQQIDFVNKLVGSRMKKMFGSAFFVFGFLFDNKQIESDIEIRIILNGISSPLALQNDAKVVSKSIAKIKVANDNFDTGGLDLEI